MALVWHFLDGFLLVSKLRIVEGRRVVASYEVYEFLADARFYFFAHLLTLDTVKGFFFIRNTARTL